MEHPPPKWIVPLLAEPVEESWAKIVRHGQIVEQPSCIIPEPFQVTNVDVVLRIRLERHRPVDTSHRG